MDTSQKNLMWRMGPRFRVDSRAGDCVKGNPTAFSSFNFLVLIDTHFKGSPKECKFQLHGGIAITAELGVSLDFSKISAPLQLHE